MDPAKSAHAENVDIIRDRVHITLTDGTIQFTQPVNGVVFGAVFHGKGTLQAEPPNPNEAQQLRLFTKQDKLDVPFTDATFSFTDGLLDEVAKQVKWQTSGPATDDLYANRQKEREDSRRAYLPRLFKGILSSDKARTAYFLADLKTNEKSWVESVSMTHATRGDLRWALGGCRAAEDTRYLDEFSRGEHERQAWKDPSSQGRFLDSQLSN